jgi:hypothetical protein
MADADGDLVDDAAVFYKNPPDERWGPVPAATRWFSIRCDEI